VATFFGLSVALLLAWLLGWGALGVGGEPMHLLLVLAVASWMVHFVRTRGAIEVATQVPLAAIATEELIERQP
jgi:hypothetical protein